MHPILFETNFFVLHTLWIFIGIGILLSIYTLIKFSTANGLKLQFLSDNFLKLIFWFIVGARILSILSNFQNYFYEFSIRSFLQLFFIWDKGLDGWGGVLAMLIALFFLCKKNEQNFLKWLDVMIPSMIVALIFMHIGTFFDGINYGNETSLPWGVNFESPSIKYAVPIHPTQIYAFLYSIITLVILQLLKSAEKTKTLATEQNGFIGITGIIIYSSFKFLEEFLRGDDTWTILGIRTPQILTFIILISTIVIFYKKCYFRNRQ